MTYDAVVWLPKKVPAGYVPPRHACRGTPDRFVSLCGKLDMRLWVRPRPYSSGNPWLRDVTCRECLWALRRERLRALVARDVAGE